jgi:hypothetical protein
MYGYGPSRVCADHFLKMPTRSAISFGQKLTYAAYKDIPMSYLFCEPDKCVTTELQTRIIAAMESEMGGKTVDQHLVKAEPQNTRALLKPPTGPTQCCLASACAGK